MQPLARPGVADVQGRTMFSTPFAGTPGQPAQGALPPAPQPALNPGMPPPMPTGPGAGSTMMLPGESLQAYNDRMAKLGFGTQTSAAPPMDEASKKLMAQLTGGSRMGSQGTQNPMLGGIPPAERQSGPKLPSGLPVQRRDQDIDDSKYGGGTLDMRAGAPAPATPGAPPPLTPSQQAARDNPLTWQMRQALAQGQSKPNDEES